MSTAASVQNALKAYTLVVPDLSQLRKTDPTLVRNGSIAFVRGYYAPEDGGGGDYEYDSNATGSDDGALVIRSTGATGPIPGPGRWLMVHDKIINAKRFGARGNNSPTGDIDTDPLQKAINYGMSLHGASVYVPAGVYKVSKLFIGRSASNPAADPTGSFQGRFTLYGDGCGAQTNVGGGDRVGTFIISNAATGHCINVFTGTGYTETGSNMTVQNLVIRDMTFRGGPDGYVLRLLRWNTCANIDRVGINYISNDTGSDGGGVYIEESTQFKMSSMFVYGNGDGNGIQMRLNPAESLVPSSSGSLSLGGANMLFQDVSVQRFRVGWHFGNGFNTSRRGVIRDVTLMNCQAKDCLTGMWIRQGIQNLLGLNMHWEGNGDTIYDLPNKCDLAISDGAAWSNFNEGPTYDVTGAPGQITFLGGTFADGGLNTASGDTVWPDFAHIYIGSTGGRLDPSSFAGPLNLIGCVFTSSRGASIKKYPYEYTTSPTLISRCSFKMTNSTGACVVQIPTGATGPNITMSGIVVAGQLDQWANDDLGADVLDRIHTDFPGANPFSVATPTPGAFASSGAGYLDLSSVNTEVIDLIATINSISYISTPTAEGIKKVDIVCRSLQLFNSTYLGPVPDLPGYSRIRLASPFTAGYLSTLSLVYIPVHDLWVETGRTL